MRRPSQAPDFIPNEYFRKISKLWVLVSQGFGRWFLKSNGPKSSHSSAKKPSQSCNCQQVGLQQSINVGDNIFWCFFFFLNVLMNAYFLFIFKYNVKRHYACKCKVDISIGIMLNSKSILHPLYPEQLWLWVLLVLGCEKNSLYLIH